MNFGSEELENFITYINGLVERLKDEDFDIKSAKIVHKIKPLGLKKPLVAYAIFKTFFTVNINQQLRDYGKLYLNLVKKYTIINVDWLISTLSYKLCWT